MTRIDRHEYFMGIARETAKRGTCDRAKVGAVAVKKNRIIATGYNGSPPKMPHCDDVGHMMENEHCIRTIHAEMNIICQCAIFGNSLFESTIYCTHLPCFNCMKHLIAVGVKTIIYEEDYGISYIGTLKQNYYNRVDIKKFGDLKK